MGWKHSFVKYTNSWSLAGSLDVELFSEELVRNLMLLNLYGPYSNRHTYWTSLTNKSFIDRTDLIIGGDLNLSLGGDEIWGPNV